MVLIIRSLCLLAAISMIATGCAHNARLVSERDDPIAEEPRAASPEPAPQELPSSERSPFEGLTDADLERALDRAIDAALAAGGRSPCERSYNAMVAMRDSLVADLGEAAAQELPARNRFIEACELLPEDAQRCMDVGYAMAHTEECQRVMDAVPREQRRPLEEVLLGN